MIFIIEAVYENELCDCKENLSRIMNIQCNGNEVLCFGSSQINHQ